ncbi:MAG TPA: tetratricopeptide repeat protein [Chitinophagaceae bacterium]
MKQKLTFVFFCTISILLIQCKSGLVTMNNSCSNSIQQGQAANKAGNYSNALDLFNGVLQKCDAYDAKEKGYAGKAAALNGMQQYNEALDAATKGLTINKTSIDNLFEKANAELGLKRTSDAKADFNTIIDLTSKNQNVKDRATIYAKMGEIDLKQNMYTDAMNNVEQALALDANNSDFYMLRGDIKAAQQQFDDANADYNLAMSKGKDDAEVWKAKAITSVKSYQKKYSTMNANELVAKMSSTEKQGLCSDIKTAMSKGVKDMTLDLLQSAVCK